MCFHQYDVYKQVKIEVTWGRGSDGMVRLGFFVNLVDGYTGGFSLYKKIMELYIYDLCSFLCES